MIKENSKAESSTEAGNIAKPLLPAVSRDEELIKMLGSQIMKESEDYRRRLYSFYIALKYLADNKVNFEFNQK